MTRDEQIDRLATELCEVCRSRHKCNTEGKCTMAYIVAEGLYEVDYRKQIKAEWTPIKQYSKKWGVETINYYRCSNCDNLQYTDNTKYCPNCGAKMKKEGAI